MKKYYTIIPIVLISLSCTKGIIPEDDQVVIEEKVTFEKHIKPVVFNRCLTCHGSVNPSANLTLETYDQNKVSAENGTLIERINDAQNPMPPNNLLPANTRALFNKWKQDGFLKN
ncbi:MAG: hypothetical protein N4A45_07590 [Flavobacteriales bacterium]|jgi:uncharacterized membrane protein|nr:hypothetical protein [Flavobacteriales bacterium]